LGVPGSVPSTWKRATSKVGGSTKSNGSLHKEIVERENDVTAEDKGRIFESEKGGPGQNIHFWRRADQSQTTLRRKEEGNHKEKTAMGSNLDRSLLN